MKTLIDLKKNAHNYLWSLKENSWVKQVPQFQRDFRKVGRVQTQRMTLITTIDGVEKESWVDFPKASEMQLTQINDDMYCLIITHKDSNKNAQFAVPPHIMIYELKRVI